MQFVLNLLLNCIYLGVVFAFNDSVSAFLTVGNYDLQFFLRSLYVYSLLPTVITPGSHFNPPPQPRVIITGRPKAELMLRFHLFYSRCCFSVFKCFNFNNSVC